MSVSAYALTAYRIERPAPLQGALGFAVTNTVGAMMILFGIALLYGRTGALNMAQVGAVLAARPADGLVIVSFALIVGGFLVKAAIVPVPLLARGRLRGGADPGGDRLHRRDERPRDLCGRADLLDGVPGAARPPTRTGSGWCSSASRC